MIQEKSLPKVITDAHRIAVQAPMFTMIDEILYYLDDKQPTVKWIVVSGCRYCKTTTLVL